MWPADVPFSVAETEDKLDELPQPPLDVVFVLLFAAKQLNCAKSLLGQYQLQQSAGADSKWKQCGVRTGRVDSAE